MSSTPLQQLLNYVNELIRSFDELITTLKGNMKLSVGWTAFVFLLGLATTAVFYKLQRFQNMNDVVKLGPTLLTSSISAFQIKTITVGRERIVGFNSLKGRLQNCSGLAESQIDVLVAEAVAALKDIRERGKE